MENTLLTSKSSILAQNYASAKKIAITFIYCQRIRNCDIELKRRRHHILGVIVSVSMFILILLGLTFGSWVLLLHFIV